MDPFKALVLLMSVLVVIYHSKALDSQVEITSLSNSTCQLNVSTNSSEEPVTFSGDPYKSCDLTMQSTNIIRVLISTITANITATGFEYFYVDRFESEDQCYHRYVAFRHPLQTCNVSFRQKHVMRIHFRGNFSIVINADKTLEAGDSSRCPEEIFHQDKIGQASSCGVEGYETITHCSKTINSLISVVVECDMQCPDNCSCVLGNKKVMYSCSESNHRHQIKNRLLIYPSFILTFNVSLYERGLSFDFSQNGLTALMPDSFTSIGKYVSYIDISNNKLVSLPPGSFNGLHTLDTLTLSRNHLKSLPPQLFNGLHELQRLYLDNNYLESLPADLFNGVHELRTLDLDNNYLESLPTDLFKGLRKLSTMSLSSNRLVSLSLGLFNELHELFVFHLTNNYLVSLSPVLFNDLHELFVFYLSNNYLVSLSPGLFNDLHELVLLYLTFNYLKSLPADLFRGSHKLYLIYLQNNQLVSLSPDSFSGLHKLNSLWMQNNHLDLLPAGLFNDLNSLVILNLENNYLVSLPATLFKTNGSSLENLLLADNQLQFLSFHLFDDLINLEFLDLSNNRLTHIPRLGHMTQLSTLNMIGNPLTGITHEHFDGISETVTIIADQSVICVCYMNSSDTCFNTKERSSYLTCSPLLSLTILSIFTWTLGICATIGNGFVLFWKQSKYSGQKNKVQSLLLSNLAVSDFLMGIYMIIIASADAYYKEYFPMSAEEWRSGLTCRIASTLAFTSSEASVFFVTLISIDRLINIKFPYTLRKLRIKSTRWSSAMMWATSLTLGLSASISAGRNSEFYDNSHVCIGLPLAQLVRFNTSTTSVTATLLPIFGSLIPSYETVHVVANKYRSPGLYFSVAVFIGLNMLCFLLILSCYIVIIKTVFQTSKAASRQREMAEEIRMTVKVSAIVLTDFFCWFPICLIGALVQAGVVTIPPETFAWVVTFVLPINSAINPFMYTIGSLIGDKCGKKSPPSSQVQMRALSLSQLSRAVDKT